MSKQQWENGATGKCARTAYINVSKNERIYCKYYKRRRQEASWDVQGAMEPSPSCIRRSINKAALVAVEALSMNRAEQSGRAPYHLFQRVSPSSILSREGQLFVGERSTVGNRLENTQRHWASLSTYIYTHTHNTIGTNSRVLYLYIPTECDAIAILL